MSRTFEYGKEKECGSCTSGMMSCKCHKLCKTWADSYGGNNKKCIAIQDEQPDYVGQNPLRKEWWTKPFCGNCCAPGNAKDLACADSFRLP